MSCGIGARTQATLDNCIWSQSQKLLHGGAEGGAWNLDSGYTA